MKENISSVLRALDKVAKVFSIVSKAGLEVLSVFNG